MRVADLDGGASAQDLIKHLITSLMLSTPPRVRAQLSEALTIISAHDFPAKWQVRSRCRAAATAFT